MGVSVLDRNEGWGFRIDGWMDAGVGERMGDGWGGKGTGSEGSYHCLENK